MPGFTQRQGGAIHTFRGGSDGVRLQFKKEPGGRWCWCHSWDREAGSRPDVGAAPGKAHLKVGRTESA